MCAYCTHEKSPLHHQCYIVLCTLQHHCRVHLTRSKVHSASAAVLALPFQHRRKPHTHNSSSTHILRNTILVNVQSEWRQSVCVVVFRCVPRQSLTVVRAPQCVGVRLLGRFVCSSSEFCVANADQVCNDEISAVDKTNSGFKLQPEWNNIGANTMNIKVGHRRWQHSRESEIGIVYVFD